MAKKAETVFKENVYKKIRALKLPKFWIEKIQQRTIRGTPDFLICCNGLFLAWELKVDSPLDTLQKHKLECIKEAGGRAFVVTPANLNEHLEGLKCLSLLNG